MAKFWNSWLELLQHPEALQLRQWFWLVAIGLLPLGLVHLSGLALSNLADTGNISALFFSSSYAFLVLFGKPPRWW